MLSLADRLLTVKGLGAAKRARLVDAFGSDLNGLNEEDSETLSALCDAVGVSLAEDVLASMREHHALASFVSSLSSSPLVAPSPSRHHTHRFNASTIGWTAFFCPLSEDQGQMLARVYGAEAFSLLSTAPHAFLPLLPWNTCEQVLGCGVGSAACSWRLSGAVETALLERLDQGRTKVREDAMRCDVARLLALPVADPLVDQAFAQAVALERVEQQGDVLQLKGVAVMARDVKARVLSMSAIPSLNAVQAGRVPGVLAQVLDVATDGSGFVPTPEQRGAVALPFTTRFSLLAGYAGSGKTTVLARIGDVAEALGLTTHFLALAGRAAQRITTLTGRPARTIAGFLTQHQGGQTLTDQDIVIIDESSMLDLITLWRVLRVLGPARLMLVGDPAQLPPIGYGRTFHAFVDWPKVPKVVLERVHRQGAETGIPAVAEAVRNGHTPTLPVFPFAAETLPSGVFSLTCSSEDVQDTLAQVGRSLAGWGVPADDVQILSPIKQGPAGTHAVHAAIHARRRHRYGHLPAFASRDDLDIGSAVLWTENAWDRGLTNGSLGRLLHKGPLPADGRVWDGFSGTIDATAMPGFAELPPLRATDVLALFDGQIHRLTPRDAKRLAPATALSIHKSQGSQWPVVVVLLPKTRLMSQALLYTATTRAQRIVVLLEVRPTPSTHRTKSS